MNVTDTDTDTRPVTDLVTALQERYATPQLWQWRGQELMGSTWQDAPAPAGGDTVRMGALDMCRDASATHDGARYLQVPVTAWGDYCGDTCARSNARSILASYGDDVVTVNGDFGSQVLLLPLAAVIPADLFDGIADLAGYPLWDESDLSDLEWELQEEDWQAWARDEFRDAIRSIATASTDDGDDDVPEMDDDRAVDTLAWELAMDGDVLQYVAETAVSGYFTDIEHAAQLAWERILTDRVTAAG